MFVRVIVVVVSLVLWVGHAFANPDSVVFEGGDVRINGAGNGLVFPDGSIQNSATKVGLVPLTPVVCATNTCHRLKLCSR